MTKWISDYWGPIEGERLADTSGGDVVIRLSKMVNEYPDSVHSVGSEMIFSPSDLHEVPEKTVAELADEIHWILRAPIPGALAKLGSIERIIEPHVTKPTVESEVKRVLGEEILHGPLRESVFNAIKPYLKDEL